MEAEDFHFYQDLKTALDIGDMFVLTGFTVLPQQGGLLDQDWFIYKDLLTYLRGYTWGKHINNPKENGNGNNDIFNFDRPGVSTNPVKDIDDFIN